MAQSNAQRAFNAMNKWFTPKSDLSSFSIDGEFGHFVVTVKTPRTTIVTSGDTRMAAISKMKETYTAMKKANSL